MNTITSITMVCTRWCDTKAGRFLSKGLPYCTATFWSWKAFGFGCSTIELFHGDFK